MSVAIAIHNLTFAYPGRDPVLRIADLSIARGERVFLEGPSGSGKTTLFGLIAGVLPAPAGTVEVLGADLGSLSSRRRDAFRGRHLGYIFQQFNLVPYLNVLDNILLGARMSPERHARGGATQARALADRLGIAPLLNENVQRLSVGQQQRVAAARALLGDPELILADEPTSSLDVAHRESFLDLLISSCAQQNATLLFSSHDPSLAVRFDRRIAL
ncbi:MAG: ABC transporter ATP-binding protein [Bryobacter sp.]|jgi:putative ABC transport system ATP-binding protein|nr:ABC transporter ATP-binding protein [Bryobacter sp.]